MPTRMDGGPAKKKRPPRVDKQTTIQARKDLLPPWMVPPPRPARRPAPIPQPKLAHPTFIEALRPHVPGTVRAPTSRPDVFRRPPPPRAPTRKEQKKQEDTQYKWAMKAPVSRAAQRKLGQSMTNEERAAYHERYKPLPPPPPIHTLGGLPMWVPGAASIPIAGRWLGGQGAVGRDINSIIAGIPSLATAGATAIGQDVADWYRDPGAWKVPHTAKLIGELGAGTAQSIATTVGFSPALYSALLRGDMKEFNRQRELQKQETLKSWAEHPVISALNVGALVAAPLRAGSIGSLARSISEANPEMNFGRALNLARHESFKPGYLISKGIPGGLPTRSLVARVESGGKLEAVGKPLARTPFGRAAQKIYDTRSARIDPNRTVIGRFSEQKRAVRQIEKRQTEAVERAQLLVQQTTNDLAKYVKGTRMERLASVVSRRHLGGQRARAAGIVYALQGPEGEVARATLHAARDDFQQILDTGGKEIPSKVRIRVEKRMDQLDQVLDRIGLGVREDGMWAEQRNLLHETGMHPDVIESIMEFDKHEARRWAKEKPGRDPSDYLASPEGRNMGEFLRQLPEDGLAGVLFQRPGYNVDVVRRAVTPEIQPGDILHDAAGFEPLTVMEVTPKGMTVARDYQGVDHTLTPDEVGQFQHQSLQPGQRVAWTADNKAGTVVSVNPAGRIVQVAEDDGTTEHWPMDQVQAPGPTRFYSKLTQTVIEKMPNKMGVNDMENFLLGKQVKPEEIVWSGLRDFMDLLKSADIKSISKQEMLDWFDNKSPFNMNELYLSPQGGYNQTPRWGREGLTTRPHDENYHEMVMTLGGKKIYTSSHWNDVSNPIFHVRFILDHETKTVYINEIQSDWHGAIRYGKRQGQILRDPYVSDTEWQRGIDELQLQANQLLDQNKRFQMKALGIPESEWDSWTNTPIRDLIESLNTTTSRNVDAAMPDARFAERNQATREALERLHAEPQWHTLLKLNKIENRFLTRSQSWNHQANNMQYAKAAAPLDGGKWRQMVLKWAVSHAVEQDFDKVAWDAGIVQAVRYHKYEPEGSNEDYYDQYAPPEPEPDDFTKAYTEAAVTFLPPKFPEGEQLSFIGAPNPLESGLMDETYAVGDLPSDYISVGEKFVPEEGPLAGQLVELRAEIDDEHVKLRPTGITRIEFRGNSEDVNSSYGEWERAVAKVHTAGGSPLVDYENFYGQLDSPSDHLEDLGVSTEAGFINDLDHDAQSNQDWRLDEDAYNEAKQDHEDNYGPSGQDVTKDPEDINSVDIWHDSNEHAQLYDEPRMENGVKKGGLLHGDVKTLFGKKYKIEVKEGRRAGKYTAEGRDWESDWGPIKVWEFPITPEMAADVRKGQLLFQTSEGVPLGASWKSGPGARRMVALLEDANVSTWLHEMVGHGTDELSRRFPQEWLGVEKAMQKPLRQWGTKEHERFATWSERYFREGKPPTPEAAPLMAQLKKWLREVYQSILALGRPIPKEARDLLDRYLGKEGEGSVFTEAEQAILQERGDLFARRQELVKQERDRLLAQPDADLLDQAHTLMVDGEPHEQQAAYTEIANRRKGKENQGKPSEEQRLLSRQVQMLDDAIRSADDPESGFTDALAALTALSEQADKLFRETILDMAPEDARAGIEAALAKRRNILVNRWRERGLLPYGTGDALGYFPHASIFESLGEQLKGPVRQPQGSRRVIGRTQVSRVAARKGENLLRLYQGGRLNLDPRVLLNTVNARLRLLQTREARDALWEVGRPVASEKDVQPGWWVINREGKHVPERLRRAQEMDEQQMDDLVAAGEDFDSNVETRQGMDEFLTDYASSFARPSDQVPPEWWKAGELRAVPPEIVNGLLPKPFQGKPGGVIGTTVGLLNAAARFATILQYPIGYILSNVPANLLMQGVTHPSALVRDNFRALALRKRNPNLYHQLAQVAGDIMAEAGIPEFYPRAQGAGERFERAITKGQKRIAEKYGEVADTPYRVGTLLGYARRYGVKTDEQLAGLVEGKGAMKDLRDSLGQRTRDDLIDFNTLSQAEKETVARYFFLWPLVRGMVKWPITFARDHPLAAATIAQAGSDQFTKDTGYGRLGTPSQRSLRQLSIMPLGKSRAIDLSSMNPLGGLENVQNLLNVPEQLTRGDVGALRDAVAAMTIPQLRELLRNNPNGQSIIESTVPGSKYLTSSLGKSRGSKIWKREKWWNYMLERNVRWLPEEIDAAQMRSQADRERRQQTGTTAAEEQTDAEYAALPKILKRAGVTDPSDIKAIHDGFEAYNYVHSRTSKLDDAGRVGLVNDAVRQFYPEQAGDLVPASSMPKEQQKLYYGRLRTFLYATHNRIINAGEQMGLLPTG